MKKILSVLLAAALTMLSFTGCPEKEAKSSGPKGPDKETLALYEKSKELNRLKSIPYAIYEETFLEKEELAKKWDIKTISGSPAGTDEAGINDLAGIYIGYTPTAPLRARGETIAYIYLGKTPNENGLYPAYIYYVGAAYGLQNYKEETSYKKEYNNEMGYLFTHAGSWSIERTASGQNGSNTETVIRITLPEESKKDWENQLKNDQPAGFTEKSEWIHNLGHPYILDGEKTIVSIDGIYIKMD